MIDSHSRARRCASVIFAFANLYQPFAQAIMARSIGLLGKLLL
jgi:hypothetical protein